MSSETYTPLCYIQIWWELHQRGSNAPNLWLQCVYCVCICVVVKLVSLCVYLWWEDLLFWELSQWRYKWSVWMVRVCQCFLECWSCVIHMGMFGRDYRRGLLDNSLNNASSHGCMGKGSEICSWVLLCVIDKSPGSRYCWATTQIAEKSLGNENSQYTAMCCKKK